MEHLFEFNRDLLDELRAESSLTGVSLDDLGSGPINLLAVSSKR